MPKSDRTTVAETLRRVFEKYAAAAHAGPGDNGESVFSVWKTVFRGSGRTDDDVLISVMQVLQVLQKLEAQIRSNTELDDIQKLSALTTTGIFSRIFDFTSLNARSAIFRDVCTPLNLGNLGMIGRSMKDEFSEPKLSADAIKDCRETLQVVKDLLKNDHFSLDLRVSLSRHIDTMLWWLTHPEIMGMQDLFEQSGVCVVVSSQIEQNVDEDQTEAKAKSHEISSKLRVVFDKVGSAMGFVVKHADDIAKLDQTAHNLISSL